MKNIEEVVSKVSTIAEALLGLQTHAVGATNKQDSLATLVQQLVAAHNELAKEFQELKATVAKLEGICGDKKESSGIITEG